MKEESYSDYKEAVKQELSQSIKRLKNKKVSLKPIHSSEAKESSKLGRQTSNPPNVS